jgi:hypothetical protein
MNPITLTAETVRSMLRIDLKDGKLYWIVPHGRWKDRPAGKLAGCLRKGYRYIHIGGENHFGHRLAWLIEHGSWPARALDHINGERDDNRPSNLRLATVAENNQNQHGLPAHNTSGLRGVSWDAARGKWTSRISVMGRSLNLGRFDDKEQAHEAYLAAKRTHHPVSDEVQR